MNMNTMTDTLTAAQALQDAGVEEAQAKAHVQVVAQIVKETQGDLATKADIVELKSAAEANVVRLEADISGLKSATEAAISGLESKISGLESETKADTARLESKISGLESDVSELKSDVSELKSEVSELKSAVSGLKSAMQTMQWTVGIGFAILALMIALL